MTNKKIQEVIDTYRRKFEELGIKKADCSHLELLDSFEHGLEHCHGMLDKMEGFMRESRIEKVFRWLGFIQGCLWSQKIYTLEELKNHSRPD